MKLSTCKTLDDVFKYLLYKGHKQNYHLVEVEQIHNMLLVTYAQVVEPKEESGLIYRVSLSKDKEPPAKFMRVKVDLSKFIEPYKSKKEYYKSMRDNATKEEILQ